MRARSPPGRARKTLRSSARGLQGRRRAAGGAHARARAGRRARRRARARPNGREREAPRRGARAEQAAPRRRSPGAFSAGGRAADRAVASCRPGLPAASTGRRAQRDRRRLAFAPATSSARASCSAARRSEDRRRVRRPLARAAGRRDTRPRRGSAAQARARGGDRAVERARERVAPELRELSIDADAQLAAATLPASGVTPRTLPSDFARARGQKLSARQAGLTDRARQLAHGTVERSSRVCASCAAGGPGALLARSRRPADRRARRRAAVAGLRLRRELPADQRGPLEAALEEAGLLDAWISPDGSPRRRPDRARADDARATARRWPSCWSPTPASRDRRGLVGAVLASIPLEGPLSVAPGPLQASARCTAARTSPSRSSSAPRPAQRAASADRRGEGRRARGRAAVLALDAELEQLRAARSSSPQSAVLAGPPPRCAARLRGSRQTRRPPRRRRARSSQRAGPARALRPRRGAAPARRCVPARAPLRPATGEARSCATAGRRGPTRERSARAGRCRRSPRSPPRAPAGAAEVASGARERRRRSAAPPGDVAPPRGLSSRPRAGSRPPRGSDGPRSPSSRLGRSAARPARRARPKRRVAAARIRAQRASDREGRRAGTRTTPSPRSPAPTPTAGARSRTCAARPHDLFSAGLGERGGAGRRAPVGNLDADHGARARPRAPGARHERRPRQPRAGA